MLLDLLSPSNMVSFNIKVADLIDIESAVYLSELMSINEKAIRKNKMVDEIYFTVDREYILNRTTIPISTQKLIDSGLSDEDFKILVPHKSIPDTFYIDIDFLASLIDAELPQKDRDRIRKFVSEKSRKNTKSWHKQKAKESVKTTNPELRNLFYVWIDTTFNKGGFLSPGLVEENENKLCNSIIRLESQIEVMRNASCRGYQDLSWSINEYLEKNPSEGVQKTKPERKINFSGVVF